MATIIDLFSKKVLYTHVESDNAKTESLEPNETWSYSAVKARIEARFGDNLPKHFVKAMAGPQKQPYMHGDSHNVQYKVKTRGFNKPMPVPCEVTVDSCARIGGILTLGSKCELGIDEPLPWMDSKYQVTLNFLKSLKSGIVLTIYTRSDLVARQDYVEQLKRLNVTVIILASSEDDALNRHNEPGAPSYKRRLEAVETLKSNGIEAYIRMHRIPSNAKIA